MEVRFRDSRIDRTKADLLVLPVREKQVDTPEVDALNRRLKGHLRAQIQRSKFTGAEGSALLYPSAGMLPANQILLIGIGSASESVLDSWRMAGARARKDSAAQGAEEVAIFFSPESDSEAAAAALIEGALLAGYQFNKYRSNAKGLNHVHLRSLMNAAQFSDDGLTYEDVRTKKKEIIEAECAGLIEFVTPRHGLDSVGGLKPAKEYLRDIAETIKHGNREEAPMGILISGPVGTGKTFLAECFARDCGMNVVEFKNFRDKWVGSTEANLEKILHLLQSLAPIVVLIDEADAALGTRESDGDSGVNQRVFSKIAAAMSNTDNRGRILWILMTSRPDLLPIDLKRQGRCEEHISLFYPEGEDARQEIAEAMARKNKIAHQITDWSAITRSPLHLSGADIESILIRTRRVARQAGRAEVTLEDLTRVAVEFTPARDELAIEYQELVAAREATSRAMLPARFQQMAGAEMARRIEELKLSVR